MSVKKMPYEERLDLIVSKWIENLRSGRFEQGRDYLNIDGKYCCLGVLCETILEFDPEFLAVGTGQWFIDGKIITFTFYDGSLYALPSSVCDLLGIDSEGQFNDSTGQMVRLTRLNDEEEKPFQVIADIIEKNKDRIFRKGAGIP